VDYTLEGIQFAYDLTWLDGSRRAECGSSSEE